MFVCVFVIMPDPCHFHIGSRITADRGKTVTHFIFLHYFGGPHYRVMCICRPTREALPRMNGRNRERLLNKILLVFISDSIIFLTFPLPTVPHLFPSSSLNTARQFLSSSLFHTLSPSLSQTVPLSSSLIITFHLSLSLSLYSSYFPSLTPYSLYLFL